MESRAINSLVCCSAKSKEELIAYALENKSILVAVNAEKILNATQETKDIINRNVGYPDGIGAVLALKQKGVKDVVKIPGCELWLEIIYQYHTTKSFYLVGGTEDVIQKTILKLKKEYPGLQILNFRNGYLKNGADRVALIQDIAEKKPDVVFVAMGSPKQELLMEEMHRVHPAVYQGLGGSFDVYIGKVLRAPKWWVKNNLEWAYRLIKQPTRIKRQIHLIKFFVLLKLGKL